MRKIWTAIPFASNQINKRLFEYVCTMNELCIDVTEKRLEGICFDHNYTLEQVSNSEYRIYRVNKLVCVVKQIEIDLQGVTQVPKSEISY